MRGLGTRAVTPIVQKLILINLVIWFIFILIGRESLSPFIFKWFGFSPALVLNYGVVWQFITYSFVHSLDVFHILFNLLCLWMFGVQLEEFWGSKKFLIYYLVCALGAALLYFFYVLGHYWIVGDKSTFFRFLVGASGAVLGLAVGFGYVFRHQTVYFMMIFPMKAWHFAILLTGIEVAMLIESGLNSQVAYAAHLGGIITGFLYLYLIPRLKVKFAHYKIRKSRHPFRVVVNNEREKKPRTH